MPDTTGTINAKSLHGTGFTEEMLNQLFNKVGTHHLAIVDLQVIDKHGPSVDGKRKVVLIIDGIEPATDENLAEHLRELNRTLYYNRGLDGHTGSTIDGTERTVEDVLAAGAKHKPHPFLPVDATEENPICDVCGTIEPAGPHSVQETLTGDEDTPSDDETEVVDEPVDSVDAQTEHGFVEGNVPDDDWEYDQPEGTGIKDPFVTT